MTQDIPIYQVDAFASELFAGNPAAVCPLDDWLPDDVLQAIAAENNLSETAYFKANGEDYDLRWFTPVREVDLCGHATLGTAYVIANHFATERDSFRFHTRSGVLEVQRAGEDFTMDFPTREGGRVEETDLVSAALRNPVQEVWRGQDIMAVLASEAEVRALAPNMTELALLDTRGVIHFRRGNLEQSRADLEACAELPSAALSTRARALFHLARTLAEAGDHPSARSHLEQARRIDESEDVFTDDEQEEIAKLLEMISE